MTSVFRARSLFALLVLALVAYGLSAVEEGAEAQSPADIRYVYDELGRLTAVVDPANGTASYRYDAVGNLLSISRLAANVVSVLEFSPNAAPVGGSVTISGTGFSATASENTVRFNGVLASVSSTSVSQLVASVPSGASSGVISVTTPAGSASSVDSFTVSSSTVPSISSFTPSIGVPGASVSISGANFDVEPTGNRLKFNLNHATVSTATGSSLTALVPPETGSGRISVSTVGGQAVGGDFFIPPSPYQASDVEVTGRMTYGETRVVTISTPTRIALTVFDGTAGQRISIRAFNRTTPSTPSVSIRRPDGSVLAAGAIPIPGSWFDRITLATTGTYTVMVDPGGNDTGSLSLSLYDVPPDPTGTITIGGPAATSPTTVIAQNSSLTFGGSAGQRVFMQMTASTYGGCVAVTMSDPADATIGADSCMNPNEIFDTRTLATTGTYRLGIDPPGTLTGNATFRIWDVPADATGTITVGGPPVTISTTTPGQNASLFFDASANQRIFTRLNSASYGCAAVTVYKPDGAILSGAMADSCMNAGENLETFTLPVTGTYRIGINPPNTQSGSLTFQIYDVPADPSSVIMVGGPAVTSPTTSVGQNANLTFDGTTNQIDRLTMTARTYTACPSVTIFRPDNTSTGGDSCMNAGEFIDRTLTATGVWRIHINPSGITTGNATFTLVQTGTQGAAAAAPEQATVEESAPPASSAPDEPAESSPTPAAADAGTALTGRVRTLDDEPLADVTFEIDGTSVRSDSGGVFTLPGVEAGHRELIIDGRTANTRTRTYGVFEVGVDLVEGRTTTLDYTIWMPQIDMRNARRISSPTTSEVVLTTPRIPGLEVRIPGGTVITDHDGEVVRELSITPLDIDRPPFSLAPLVETPVYFTVQPGGAYLSKKARIIYPNTIGGEPGTRVGFWHYDPEREGGWYEYGKGTVTADGRQVVPDPGVGVYEFTGAMINFGRIAAALGRLIDVLLTGGGDPVDLGTGLFVLDKADLVLPDVLPLSLTRSYRPLDSQIRPFGMGASHPYELFLYAVNGYIDVDLILPDSSRVRYTRISPGSSYGGAILEAQNTPTAFNKSRLAWTGQGWDLTLKDGTVYAFGDAAPLQSIRDRYGNKITLTRAGNERGNITRVRSPNGRWIQFTYDASNRITQVVDNIGRTVGYTYDASGRLWRVTDPAGGVTEYGYDASHRMTTIRDARNIVFLTNEYDAGGRVIEQTQADGGTYQFDYTLDGNGRIIRTDVTDPRNVVRRVTFNSSGYISADTHAQGAPEQQTTSYERAATTNFVTAATDELGRRTNFTYDTVGNITQVTRLAGTPGAITTSFTYEPAFNQVATVTDPLDHVSEYDYNAAGSLIRVTDALGNETEFTYNGAGQVTSTTDPLENQTQFSYDLGDLVRVTDPLGRITTRFVDAAGRVAAGTDSLGNFTRFQYDAFNNLTRSIEPLGGATAFAYDANGNLRTVTDARNNETSYTYDDLDRPVTRRDPLDRAENYSYDGLGNLLTRTDRKNQTTAFNYDPLGRLVFTGFRQQPGPTYESTITYSYDDGNRITQVADSAAGTITRTYDNLDRLTGETAPQGSVTYAYDAASRRTTMTASGEPAVAYVYDSGDRLTRITKAAQEVDFGYDAASRRTSLTLPGDLTTTYGYDDASQLTSLTYRRGQTTLGDIDYAYDPSGRRTAPGGTFARTDLPDPVASITHDAANQMTSRVGVTFTYDDNGNLTSDGTTTYTWNARDELTTTTGPSPFTFAYDGVGRRIRKTAGGTATEFVYDGVQVVQERQSGATTAAMLTSLAVDEVLTRTTAGTTQTLLADALGSTLALTDSAGTVQTSYTYQPFGRATTAGAASSNPIQFTGREADTSDLHYVRARYYHPTLGRFISQDPIGFEGGDTNLYAYVGNSPTNYTDPSGECLIGALLGTESAMNARKSFWGVLKSAASGCISDIALGGLFGGVVKGLKRLKGLRYADNLAPGKGVGLLQRLRNRVGDFAAETGALGSAASRLTNSQAADVAKWLGFRAAGGWRIKGQQVFTDGRRYIVQDIDAHLPDGLWKMGRRPDDLLSKQTRMGTYDYALNRVGA